MATPSSNNTPNKHTCDNDAESVLQLTLIDGLGPVRISRLISAFGSAQNVLRASHDQLQRVPGIGPKVARTLFAGRTDSAESVRRELDLAQSLGVDVIPLGDDRYPTLLTAIPNPPPVLYVRGALQPQLDRYTVAMVGSRGCTSYGIEQAERFAGLLAQSGLTIVSGGARGIDSAAHRAALRHKGRTIAVLGCGLARCYPPENKALFDEIASGAGAVVSELPLETNPASNNFPARNRIISGLSLGVLVIEAAAGSGALITARLATEEHGREVMAVPGRIDSPASEGVNDLLKRGGAAMVTSAADVLDLLEAPARHLHAGVHQDRYADPTRGDSLFDEQKAADSDDSEVDVSRAADASSIAESKPIAESNLTATQQQIIDALADPMSLDELSRKTGIEAGVVRAETTMLEIRQVIVRAGDRLQRRSKR